MKSVSKEILALRNLSIGYKSHVIVSGIDTVIGTPQLISIIGPNGAGKSTLLKTITGELHPLSGNIQILDRKLSNYNRKELSHLISIVTTDSMTGIGGLTVRELVNLGRDPHTGFFGKLSKEDHEIAEDAINRVGIGKKAEKFIGQLSDGERQKAMIARALAQQTPIICLDEPFSFLDPPARIELLLLLLSEAHEKGKLIIMSTHDVHQALIHSDTIWLVGNGKFESMSAENASQSSCISDLYPSDGVIYDNKLLDFRAL